MKMTVELKKLNRTLSKINDALMLPQLRQERCYTLKDLLEAEEQRIKQQIRKLREHN